MEKEEEGMTMKSSSVDAKCGASGTHFGEDVGRFWSRFGTWEAQLGRSEGNSDTSALKRGGVLFRTLPFWPEKWVPGARREVPRGPENRQKKARREDEEAM